MSADAGTAHKLRRLWLSIGWLLVALVVYLSLVSGRLPIDTIVSDEVSDRFVYGFAHALAYATLMWWFLQLYPATRRAALAVGLIAMGILLEVLQGITLDRTPGYLDVLANIAGVLLGWLLGKTPLSRALEIVERRFIRRQG